MWTVVEHVPTWEHAEPRIILRTRFKLLAKLWRWDCQSKVDEKGLDVVYTIWDQEMYDLMEEPKKEDS